MRLLPNINPEVSQGPNSSGIAESPPLHPKDQSTPVRYGG